MAGPSLRSSIARGPLKSRVSKGWYILELFAVPLKVGQLMADFRHPWGVCGGWGIDLFLDRVTRPHKDIEVAILRRDQMGLQSHLAERRWTLQKVHEGQLSCWLEGEFLELPVHEVRCRNLEFTPNCLEILLNETDGSDFLFRRDPSITLPLDKALQRAKAGLPILAPEIILLYKAKDTTCEQNADDFHNALPHLAPTARAWLRAALRRVHTDHQWLDALR